MLADGLFVHTAQPAAGTFWEADLRMPNVDCQDCVVQVIQWMGEHGYNPDGGYTYHHCATVRMTRNPDLATVRGRPSTGLGKPPPLCDQGRCSSGLGHIPDHSDNPLQSAGKDPMVRRANRVKDGAEFPRKRPSDPASLR